MDHWRLGHRPALDGLRGIAILLVLLAHTTVFDGAGPIGVMLFFVLSGFLITSLLVEERESAGRTSLRGFYRRRFFRLFPAMLAMIIGALIIQSYTNLGISPRTAGMALISASNWWNVAGYSAMTGLGHTWSLGIEEQFYLLWPVVLVACSRWGRRGIAAAALIGIAISTAMVLIPGGPNPHYGTGERLGALLLGCLLAVVARSLPEGRSRPGLLIGALLISVPLWGRNDLPEAVYLLGVPPLAAVMIWATARGEGVSWLSGPVLRWFGKRSYGIYLWHYPIAFATFPHMPNHRPVAAVIIIGLACLVAEVSWRTIEQPLQQWNRRRVLGQRLNRRPVPPAASRPVDRLYGAAVPPA